MSLKLWRKLRSASRINQYSRKIPQIYPGRLLTKKQKKSFRYNRNFYSGEITFPISKHKVWQLANKFPSNGNIGILTRNFSLAWKSLSNSFQNSGVFVGNNRGQDFSYKHPGLFIFKNANNLDFTRVDFVNNWQAKKVTSTPGQLKVNLSNLPWFLHNPSPIPGIFKMSRLNSSYLKETKANHNLSLYLGNFHREKMLFLWSSCFFSSKNPSLWQVIQRLERYWPLLLTKMGFERRIFVVKQKIQHFNFLVNGQNILKVWRVAYPGDIVVSLASKK